METQNSKLKTQNGWRVVAWVALGGLMFVLALRLTMSESVRVSLSQLGAQVAGRIDPSQVVLPEVGAAVTIGLSCVVLLLVGMAAWCGGKCGAMGWVVVGKLVLILAVLGVGIVSMCAAANRFYALVGLMDVGMALMGGWAVSVLCQGKVLGDIGRRIVIATMIAVLASWTAKGLYQRIVEIPDTISYYLNNKEKSLAAEGLRVDDPEVKLFESRMMSKEVGGFVTLSNVMATGMVGMSAVLCGVVGAGIFCRKKEEGKESEDEESDKRGRVGEQEISIVQLLLWCGGILAVAGLAATFLTASRGGSVMAVVCAAAVVLGIWRWQWVMKRRRALLGGAMAFFLVGMLAMVGYGMRYDTLPSKSMMFRWHYWTGSVPMIEKHPLTGVGLNNFGDYYTAYKRASTPEDVKDPHSFFVRFAAEMGLPAAVMIGGLLVWMMWSGVRKRAGEGERGIQVSGGMLIVTGSVAVLGWWLLHYVMSDPADDYSLYLDLILAVIAGSGWAMAVGLTGKLTPEGLRCVMAAGLVGAMGMFVYDQVNMALVTGQVAMLFWFLLGAADSYEEGNGRGAGKAMGMGVGGLCAGAAACLAAVVWWPTLQGKMAWDPEPYEVQFQEAMLQRKIVGKAAVNVPDYAKAEAAIDAAMQRAPRALDILRQRVALKETLHQPVADDIRRMLALDRTNARFRMGLVLGDSDLPAAERIAVLEETLRLDVQLAPDEVKRLTDAEKTQIRETIARLKGEPG